jgi:hypothetical protein
MITKFLSLAALITSAALFSLDLKNPQDPIFFVVSGGLIAEIARFMLVLLATAVVFAKLPKSLAFKVTLSLSGASFILGGFVGAYLGYFNASIDIKPVDFLMLAETGIILMIVALSPDEQVRPNVSRRSRQTNVKLAGAPAS